MTVDDLVPTATDPSAIVADYRGAITFMTAVRTGGSPAVLDDDGPFPRALGLGLVELCDRLLQRYERLSQVNKYAEPPVSPLEHLRLLALLHDRATELA